MARQDEHWGSSWSACSWMAFFSLCIDPLVEGALPRCSQSIIPGIMSRPIAENSLRFWGSFPPLTSVAPEMRSPSARRILAIGRIASGLMVCADFISITLTFCRHWPESEHDAVNAKKRPIFKGEQKACAVATTRPLGFRMRRKRCHR